MLNFSKPSNVNFLCLEPNHVTTTDFVTVNIILIFPATIITITSYLYHVPLKSTPYTSSSKSYLR